MSGDTAAVAKAGVCPDDADQRLPAAITHAPVFLQRQQRHLTRPFTPDPRLLGRRMASWRRTRMRPVSMSKTTAAAERTPRKARSTMRWKSRSRVRTRLFPGDGASRAAPRWLSSLLAFIIALFSMRAWLARYLSKVMYPGW